ncbi:Pre-mRNA-splicing factor SPF27 [Halotydeus destructor]|nr:Pre-mRNA-splicing factor SPF27 [Halotydeus destructor]
MSSQDYLVDALPYIDQGYDEPGVREAVFAMIDDETKRYKPTKNYLEHLPEIRLHEFETDTMKNEMERISSRTPMEQLSMKRYELPGPAPGKMTDIQAWTESVDNSMAQLEHQNIRLANLTIMNKFGAEAWKTYNTVLAQSLEKHQKEAQQLKKTIQEINWQRKSDQLNAAEKLKSLENNWVNLVSKNYEIEQACLDIEKEISFLEKKSSSTNNENVPSN